MSWEGPPQPNMAHRKTAKAMITSRGLCRVKIKCMTAEILSTARTQSADCKLTTRFDTLKSFFCVCGETGKEVKECCCDIKDGKFVCKFTHKTFDKCCCASE